MFEFLKSLLRTIFIDSGFFYRFLFPIIHKLFFYLPIIGSNHSIVDEGGSEIRVTKFQGKLYPPVGTGKIAGIKDITIRKSDVLLAGYPKTGCHWLYEIVHMMVNNNLSISKYGKELGGMIDLAPDIILDANPSPRVLNTHLLYDDLPHGIKSEKTKIILTLRGAKDTSVSFYNHNINMSKLYGYDGKYEHHYKLFMSGGLEYGCYFEYYHDWCRAVNSDPVNEIFVLIFEDLKKDPARMIQRMAKFLEVPGIGHKEASDIAEASSFQKMKEARVGDPIASSMMRKGVVGDWKNWMTDEQKDEIDRRWKEVEEEYAPILDRQSAAGVGSK